MDSYSIRFASGRISPNLDPRVCDCWLDTTGELHRGQRPGRYKARDASSMPRCQRVWRNGRPPPPRQTVHKVQLRLPGECCRPNRWRRGTGARLLRTHCIPDQPTALRHDARKLGRAGLASDHSEGHTIELVELDCRGRQWTLPYNLGPAEDRLYEIKLATAFVMVTLCLYQPPRST